MKNSYNNFFKTIDGEQIFYTTNFQPGDNVENVLVFNYGLVCSNFHWKEQIKYFDSIGQKILLHDYRGHYQSSGKQDVSKITIAQMAQDLNELIDLLKLDQFIMIGHSMGVNVCLEYTNLFAHKVSKLILISGTILPVHAVMMNTHLTGTVKPIIMDIMKKFPKEFQAFWKYGGWNPLVKFAIHSGGFNMEQVSTEFIEVYLNKLGQLGPDLFMQLIDQMQEHDVISFVHNLKIKALIIGGNQDKVIPNYLQRIIHSKMENSELYIIHSGSHVPQVDFPVRTNERIEYFLNS